MSHAPDSIDLNKLLQAMQQQQHQIQQLQHELAAQKQKNNSAATSAVVHATPVREPNVRLPDPFNGSPKTLRTFINQIRLVIRQQPITYATDDARVGLVGNLFTGPAMDWFSPILEAEDPILGDFENFIAMFRKRFEDPHTRSNAAAKLCLLKQGRRPVSAYASEVQLLLADAAWDEAASCFAFEQGLNDDVRDLLVTMPEAADLNGLIENAVKAGNRIYRRSLDKRNDRGIFSSSRPSALPRIPVIEQCAQPVFSHTANDPMILDATAITQRTRRPALTPQEKARRLANNLCFYCADDTHLLANCPNRTNASDVSGNEQGRHE